MTRTIHIFDATTGINNVSSPMRLEKNKGLTDLVDAQNVLIGKTGDLVSYRGHTRLAEGAFHSLYRHNDNNYVVKDKALYRVLVHPDRTGVELIGIRSGLTTGARVSYAPMGGKLYYTNGHQNGWLDGNISYPWPENEWTGPESTAQFIIPPVGNHLESMSGRLLIGSGNQLYFTEFALPGLTDETRDWIQFPQNIRMIKAMESGVFVSDEESVYWLAGLNPHEWTMRKVLEYPALAYGAHPGFFSGLDFGLEYPGNVSLFASSQGPVLGLPDGSAVNLINKKVQLPECSTGAIMVVDETLIIQSGA